MNSRFFNVSKLKYSFLSILLLTTPAFADGAMKEHPAALGSFKGHYAFSLGKIPIGKLGIELEQSPTHYSIVSDIVTTGLVNMIVKHSSHTTVSGSGREFAYPETEYEAHYQTRKKKKYVKFLTHRAQAGQEMLVPPDNAVTRTPVDAELKKDVVDPLSLTLRMREATWGAVRAGKGNFSLHLYDGRRLSELDFVVEEKKQISYLGKQVPVVPVTLTRKMLAGYTKSELDAADPNEPPVRLYFSDDSRFMLVRAEVSLWMGTLSATLSQECAAAESCLFGVNVE